MTEQQFEARIQGLEQANVGLQQQIDGMRRQRRRVWIAGIAIVALVAIAGAAGFTGDSFSLLSPSTNKQRIAFANSPEGKTAGFIFKDDKGGRQRLFIGHTDADTPTLQMLAPDGELTRMSLDINPENGVLMKMNSRTGKSMIVLGAGGDNLPILELFGPNGKLRASLEVPPKERGGGLMLFDTEGQRRLFVGLNEKGQPYIRFWGDDGKVSKDFIP